MTLAHETLLKKLGKINAEIASVKKLYAKAIKMQEPYKDMIRLAKNTYDYLYKEKNELMESIEEEKLKYKITN